MSEGTKSKTDDCLELRFEALLKGVLANGGVLIAVASFIIGAHAARWLFQFNVISPVGLGAEDGISIPGFGELSLLALLPIAAFAAGLVWFVFFKCVLALKLSGAGQVPAQIMSLINRTVWLGDGYRRGHQVLFVVIIGVLLVIPWWTALIAWTSVLILIWSYPNWSRGMALVFGVCLLGGVSIIGGVVVHLVVSEKLNHLAFAPAGAVLSVATLAALALVALKVANPGKKRWSVGRVLMFVPAVIPLIAGCVKGLVPGIGVFSSAQVTWISAFVAGCVIWPVFIVMIAGMRQFAAKKALNDFVSDSDKVDAFWDKIGGNRRFEILEADGWASIQRVRYYNRYRRLGMDGERGYLCLLEPDPEVSPCVAFRVNSLDDAPFLSEQDKLARAAGDLVKALLPKIGNQGFVKPIVDAVNSAWSVKRLGKEAEPLAKMPWDHPDLLIVPEKRNREFIYPDGCGIHDRNGYRGEMRVTLEIAIRTDVLETIDKINTAGSEVSTEDREKVRSLLWNMWLVLPAAYETILMGLVVHCREGSFARDESGEAGAVKGVEHLRQRVATYVSGNLPDSVSSLVDVRILKIAEHVNRVKEIVHEAQQTKQMEAEQQEKLMDIVQSYRNLAVSLMSKKQPFDIVDMLTEARKELSVVVANTPEEILKALDGIPGAGARVAEQVRSTLSDRRRGLSAQIEEKMDELIAEARAVKVVSTDNQG